MGLIVGIIEINNHFNSDENNDNEEIIKRLNEIQEKIQNDKTLLFTEDKNDSDELIPLENNSNNINKTYWQKGDTIHIAFIDGGKKIQNFVKQVSQDWVSKTDANINWKFIENINDSDARITFNSEGSWSFIGTQVKDIPKSDPTMSLSTLKSFKEIVDKRQTVLHEFGHLLGLIHEHQSPGIASEWNWEKIYSTYENAPYNWTRTQISHNFIINLENDRHYVNKPFDPASVMLYDFPPDFFVRPIRIIKTGNLSKGDIELIDSIY